MEIVLGQVFVRRVIVHEVPNRPTGGREVQVVHSEVESRLDAELQNYFRERAIQSLRSAGYQVTSHPQTSSPVPNLLYNYLQGSTTDFIGMSQRVADHLYNSQTGVNSAGLLCVMEVDILATRGIAILKLDKDEAVRIEQTTFGGNVTFDLEHLRDLILTKRTRVFKAGVFVLQEDCANTPGVDGIVSDNQRGYTPSTEVADFFLKKFLGCTLVESPDVTTKQFFYATEEFIASEISDAEDKARYETALLAELNSEDRTVNPRNFAESNLSVDHRQSFLGWLGERDVAIQQFDKDTQLIKTRLRRVSVNFESGIGVLIPPDSMGEQVTLSKMDDGLTYLEIRDRLTTVEGKS